MDCYRCMVDLAAKQAEVRRIARVLTRVSQPAKRARYLNELADAKANLAKHYCGHEVA